MIIEAVRLVVTLAATAAGYLVGQGAPDWVEVARDPDTSAVFGAVIGAGIGYVAGGLIGRLVRRGIDRAPAALEHASGAQLFAGGFGLIAGLLLGAVSAVPAIVLLPDVLGWLIAALLVIILAALGARVFAARSEDLLAAAGLGSRRATPPEPVGRRDCFVVDTSAAIDGRLLELARAGLVRGELRIGGFVLEELQGIADSGDINRRKRGRRGLDVLDALTTVPGIELRVDPRQYPEFPDVDAKVIALAADLDATLATTDHNLARHAALRGVAVLDVQSLGDSLRGGPMAGDQVSLLIERPGSEPGQGVGYMDDGTMVVVEGAASLVGDTVVVEIAGALRTSIGRLFFGRLAA